MLFYKGIPMRAISREVPPEHIEHRHTEEGWDDCYGGASPAPPAAQAKLPMALPAQVQQPLMTLPESALRSSVVRKRGHAARPGTGPKDETCGSCMHRVSVNGGNKIFSKCQLNKRNWTRGRSSDIRKKDPACARWEARLV